jgi:hypothetical protein
VMASGILCVDLYSVRQPVLAAIMLWFTAGTWLFLAAVLAQRVRHEPDRFAHEARSPARVPHRRRAGPVVPGHALAGTADRG